MALGQKVTFAAHADFTGDPIAYERLLLIPWARNGADE
jgi:hypothetical protein